MLFSSCKDWPTVMRQVRASFMGVRKLLPTHLLLELINIKTMLLRDKTRHI